VGNCCERSDEPSGSCATELVIREVVMAYLSQVVLPESSWNGE
jgi:hypothetical protein